MRRRLVEHNQNFWQMSCILGSAMGLPVMIVGGSLAKTQGPGSAVLSILIGNLILWIIGLGIYSMAKSSHNAIENVGDYLGKTAGMIAALLFCIAILIWYAIQIEAAATVVHLLKGSVSRWAIGLPLGVVAALLSIGGIRVIKWVCVRSFPFLFCYMVYAALASNRSVAFAGTWGISISGVVAVVLSWLPGIVSLPTFFRHSRSREDAVLGLSLFTFFHACFGIFIVLMGIDSIESFASKDLIDSSFAGYTIFAMAFILLSMICVNLVNIYFASASLEVIFPRYRNTVLLCLVGLCGTAVYAAFHFFLKVSFSYSSTLNYLETIADNFIVSLGTVLLLDLLVKIVVRHRPRPLEQFWSSFCWIASCIIALAVQLNNPSNPNIALISGTSAIILFLVIILVEETIWSAKKLT
ncbi:MAG: hypothetical protein JSR39_01075 [Verrucomicrobia bacterium]|nr:hypothetical protein [Verrucomicrobiota bacterium]